MEVTEEEIEAELKSVHKRKNARLVEVTDRAAEDSDVAKISLFRYSRWCVAFEGGDKQNNLRFNIRFSRFYRRI